MVAMCAPSDADIEVICRVFAQVISMSKHKVCKVYSKEERELLEL